MLSALPQRKFRCHVDEHFAAWAASTAYVLNQQIKDSNSNIRMHHAAWHRTHIPRSTTGGGTTADGATLVWTCRGSGSNPGAANWMAVSEPIVDGDNSYNSDSVVNDVDLFTIQALPAGAANISAVDNVIYCRKDDAGTRTISNEIKSGTTTSNAQTLRAPATCSTILSTTKTRAWAGRVTVSNGTHSGGL